MVFHPGTSTLVEQGVKNMKCFALLVVLLLFASVVARADVPWPGTSTIELEAQGLTGCPPVSVAVCPAGDMDRIIVTVTVRNETGDPLPGMTVECWASHPSDPFCFCVDDDPQTGDTDGEGVVQFVYDNFGGCSNIMFEAECEGVHLGFSTHMFVASVDFDGTSGDCQVGLADFAYFAQSFGGAGPCSDLDCDGLVGLADFAMFAAHFGHTCP